MSGVMHIIDDSVIKSGVARPLKVSDLASSGGGGASGETTTTVLYKLLKAWAGLAVGTTIYWVQTDTEGADPTFKWLKTDGTEIAAPPDSTYYTPAFDDATFAHQHFVDSNGVLFYYISRAGSPSVAHKVLNGSTYTPVGQVLTVASAGGTKTVYPFTFVSGTAVYTLPTAPVSASGAKLRVTGIDYDENGVDWTISGLTLTILNTAVLSLPNGTNFSFTYLS